MRRGWVASALTVSDELESLTGKETRCVVLGPLATRRAAKRFRSDVGDELRLVRGARRG